MGMFAVHRLGEDSCHARLSCTPRAGEEVSVCEAALLKRALQCRRDMLLPDDI